MPQITEHGCLSLSLVYHLVYTYKNVKIATYNMRGFNQSGAMLLELRMSHMMLFFARNIGCS